MRALINQETQRIADIIDRIDKGERINPSASENTAEHRKDP
jgi:hypothetical protein